jgi:type IV secretion system protein VirB10
MSAPVPEEQPKVAKVNNRALMLGSVVLGLVLFAGMYMLSTAGDAARTAATSKAIEAATAPTGEFVRRAQVAAPQAPSARDEYLKLRELEQQQPTPAEMQEMLERLKRSEEPQASGYQQAATNPRDRALVAPLVPAGAGVGLGARGGREAAAESEGWGRRLPEQAGPQLPSVAELVGAIGGGAGLGREEPTLDPVERRARFLGDSELGRGADRIVEGSRQGPGVIAEGSLIPATMLTEVVSDQPGSAMAVISRDVYDAGGAVVIPQGTRAHGTYDARVVFGQNRLLVAWHRLVFPDGSSWGLPNLPGATIRGASGLRDRVDHHFVRIFGSALLMSAISAGAQIAQPETSSGERLSASEIAAGAVAQELSRASAELLTRNLRIAPTIRIRTGSQFAIQVSHDLIVP